MSDPPPTNPRSTGRIALPIDPFLPEIVAAARGAQAVVIVAPPGAGKTTRVPVALLEAGVIDSRSEHPNIIVLQPRRVAARASAARIASENGWELGREVGYHVRFDRRIGRHTRLRVLTEGILTRQLLEDPFIEGIGCVILDEFHERSLNTDLAVALLREVQQAVRDDLKLIVMSATLEAEPVARFLGNCPIIRTQGRAYPVEMEHLAVVRGHEEAGAIEAVGKVISEGLGFRVQGSGRKPEGQLSVVSGPLQDTIAATDNGPRTTDQSTIRHPQSAIPKDILIFMPGQEEIRRVIAGLEPLAERENLALLPLHGSLTADEQDRALRPDPARHRKIIVATNIAETSLTIEGVGIVIDSGLARVAGYDPERGLDRLDVLRISKASATQRAGRAGRTGPGVCIRLWSEKEWERLADFETPEIRRVDLAATILELHAWGKSDVRAFGWYEAPDEQALQSAEDLLTMLGAIDPAGKITAIGQTLALLPVHPRLGRLMVAAVRAGMLREGALLAALISEKDIVRGQWADRNSLAAGQHRLAGSSDLLARLTMLEERDDRIDRGGARQVMRVAEELERMGERQKLEVRSEKREGPLSVVRGPLSVANSNASAQSTTDNGQQTTDNGPRTTDKKQLTMDHGQLTPSQLSRDPEDILLRLILWAYPDRVCRRRGSAGRGVMVGGGGVKLSPESVVHQGEFFVAIDARRDERSSAREAFVRIASRIEMAWLEEMFPSQVRREKTVEFDETRQSVAGLTRLWYRDLLLHEDKNAAVDPAQASTLLADLMRQRGAGIFRADESAAHVLDRMALLREKMPEHPWPAWADVELGEILANSIGRARNIEEIQRLPLASILQSSLAYPLDRLFDKEAPETIEVPTGNRIRLRYERGQAILAVRLQELFGLLDTPKIAGGRVPIKLELLAPNYRPVQVTMDLRSFWTTTYFQVRKDLKARYPKHSWPEDPLTARPEAKGRRKQN